MAFISLKKPYKAFSSCFQLYWKAYGGHKALLNSPYLHFSFLFSLLCYPAWGMVHKDWAWFNICVSAIPNLLGFTLGGYAILLAFGDDEFKSALSGNNPDGSFSPFMVVNATFIHFILMQIVSLFISLFALTWDIRTGAFAWLGFFIFIYALSTSIAAAFAILKLTDWFDKFNNILPEEKKPLN